MAEGGTPTRQRFFARSDFVPNHEYIDINIVAKEMKERGKSIKHIALRRLWMTFLYNLHGVDDIIGKLFSTMVLDNKEKKSLQTAKTFDKIERLLHFLYDKDEHAINSFCQTLRTDPRNNSLVESLTQFVNPSETVAEDHEAHSEYIFVFKVITTDEDLETSLFAILKRDMQTLNDEILHGNGNIYDVSKGSIEISVDGRDKWQLIEIMKMMDEDVIRKNLRKWIKNQGYVDLPETSIDVDIDSSTRKTMLQYVMPQKIEVISSNNNNFYLSSTSQYLPNGPPLKILLLGKTGIGKSHLGNTILCDTSQSFFEVHDGTDSGTRNAAIQNCVVKERDLTVVDTPGTMDTKSKKKAIHEICGAIAYCPEGFDAICIVLKYGNRLTAEERESAEAFHKLFGKEVENYSFIVFTHGDQYRKVMKHKKEPEPYNFKKFIGNHKISNEIDSLGHMLRTYKGGWILVDNYEDNELRSTRQVNELIGIVDNIRLINNNKKYANEIFEAAREMRDKFIREHVNPKEWHERIVSYLKERFEHIFDQCFPEGTTVIISTRESVPISDIKVGDRVLSVDKSGKMCYKKVYMLGHREENGLMRSVTITTKNCKLTASSGHYITVNKIQGQPLKFTKLMRDVKVGDVVMVVNIQTNCLMEEEVISVDKHFSKGMYNPFTTSGTIVVNGVVATCYEESCTPRKAHALMGIVRGLYKIIPRAVNAINKVEICGTPAWVHGSLKIMKKVRPKRNDFLD